MTVKELKKLINSLPDETQVFVKSHISVRPMEMVTLGTVPLIFPKGYEPRDFVIGTDKEEEVFIPLPEDCWTTLPL